MKKIPAAAICYSSKKRDRNGVFFSVIHNSGNKGDTAEANANYFAHNVKSTGTHFIIDQSGTVIKSINLNRTAWAVGGDKWTDCGETGGGKLYGAANNFNSVSIELCDIIDREPSEAMMAAIWRTLKYIRKYCPNATEVIRHFDVNGKHCPQRMMSEDEWSKFKSRLLKEALR